MEQLLTGVGEVGAEVVVDLDALLHQLGVEHLADERHTATTAGTGLGVLEKLGKLTDQKKVLVLSNYAGRDIRQQCLKLGASAVFDKSQEIDAFVDHISHLAQA